MSLITKLPGVTFTDSTLPLLYRDAAIQPTTVLCYDAKDTFSYPPQADGGAVWYDLTYNANNATIAADVLWDNGFKFVSGGSDLITLPTTTKLNGTEDGLLFINWIKHASGTLSVGPVGISGLSDNGGTSSQYCLVLDQFSNVNTLKMSVVGANQYQFNATPGAIYQLAISCVKTSTGYTYKFYKDGVVVASGSTTNAMPTPSQTASLIGNLGVGAFNPNWAGTYYRQVFSKSGANADAIVAADYAANNGRFA